MTEHASATLPELFSEWGSEQPLRLTDLINADYETLDPRARALRAQAVALVHQFEREPVQTAADARKLLERNHLPSPKRRWCAVALDDTLQRTYTRAEGGAMRMVHTVSDNVPDTKVLSRRAPLPKEGKYLLIYGGSPDVLAGPGVVEALALLRSQAAIADILFWDENRDVSTFYSVGSKLGSRGADRVPFPDPVLLERVSAHE
jgi:hypothetical protein